MKVVLDHVGKRFNYEWIFSDITYEFQSGNKYAVIGSNGSGKSTLIQLIAGNLTPSSGQINYQQGSMPPCSGDKIYNKIGFAAPYMELIEDYTLKEVLGFHSKFKPFLSSTNDLQALIAMLNLSGSADKELKYFSTGMKQRVKIALAILADVPVVLLDEPLTNLDAKGMTLYQRLINDFLADRLLIVCSNNRKEEYDYCTDVLDIEDYKT